MTYQNIDYEERLEALNAKNWLADETVYDRLRKDLEFSEGMDYDTTFDSRRPVRVGPCDGIIAVADPELVLRVAEHVGYGFNITCRQKSHEILLNGEPCPICSGQLAGDSLYLQNRLLMACQIHALRKDNSWRWYKNVKYSNLQWLEFDHKLLQILLSCEYLDAGIRLERTSDWDWVLKPESKIEPISKDNLRRLRRDIKTPGIRFASKNTVLEAIKVAEANAGNKPKPGRAAELLKILPTGSTLVPCYFASKRPRVFWKAHWTPDSFADFGEERADKGNLAVLMGPAKIRSFDWDNNDLFKEFLDVNPWAQKAQQSFGARGGNVWCRINLPPSQEKCWVLERGDCESNGEKVGEFRAGKCVTIVSGAHPSGVLYRVKNKGCLPFVEIADVIWPEGVRLHQQSVGKASRQATEYDDTPGEIGLDLSQIENLHEHPRHAGSLEGRCPVCASNGKDHIGEHLEIWLSGAFKCIADCDGSEIFTLVGRRRGWQGKSKNKTAQGSSHGRFNSKLITYDIKSNKQS